MKNLSIGTRLGGGFALVLLLMALMTAFGVWRLQTVALATNDMTQQPPAVGAFELRVGVREVLADVAQRRRAEQRIG